ncbi:hypothetical protein RHSIM_Rhsim08G0167600 [Rhododendron simsii]|uniref:Uncharacterized protein n=1 Tax=Rhododendron simsii TaxID=118357 RepID=A0A834GGL8_RHOSS|nr:hypothetical protein RHSIM_Rhsim08G0167600 [Rhododendron simsii]
MEATSSSYEVPAETGYNYNGGSSDATATKAKHGNNKVGEGLARTKAVASTGVKKVKEGTSTAMHWIKDKCHHKPTSTTATPAPIFSSS